MKIFGKQLGEVSKLVSNIGDVFDKNITSQEEKLEKKEKLTEIVLDSLDKITEIQGEVIKKEMSGSWLQKNWRPIIMLLFAFVLVAKWFGFTDPNISEDQGIELLGIIKIGLGGYVAGRSVEKIAETVTKNIDIPFIKKKNRRND